MSREELVGPVMRLTEGPPPGEDRRVGDRESFEEYLRRSGEYAETDAILAAESDRAMAVLGPAYLDHQMREYLAQVMVDDGGVRELLKPNSPLGTFGARCAILYGFGYICERVYTTLKLVARIRNLFAHDHRLQSFENPPVRDRCLALHVPASFATAAARWSARDRFHFTVSVLQVELAHRSHLSRQVVVGRCSCSYFVEDPA